MDKGKQQVTAVKQGLTELGLHILLWLIGVENTITVDRTDWILVLVLVLLEHLVVQ